MYKIQEVMFSAVKMLQPENFSVFQLHEHTHGALTWFHSAIQRRMCLYWFDIIDEA